MVIRGLIVDVSRGGEGREKFGCHGGDEDVLKAAFAAAVSFRDSSEDSVRGLEVLQCVHQLGGRQRWQGV